MDADAFRFTGQGPCALHTGGRQNGKVNIALLIIHVIGRDFDCANGVIRELDGNRRTCQCNADCHQTEHDISISEIKWPADEFLVTTLLIDHNK